MTQQELNAIKVRYDENNSMFRDVGRCTLNDIHALFTEVERLREQQNEYVDINLKQAQDLANFENALSAFDDGVEPTIEVVNLLMDDEEELKKWMARCAWHCRKVHELSGEIKQLREAQRWIPVTERLPERTEKEDIK